MRESRFWPRGTNRPLEATSVAFVGTTMLLGTTKIVQKIYFPPQNSKLMQNTQQNQKYDFATFFGKFGIFSLFLLPKNWQKPKNSKFSQSRLRQYLQKLSDRFQDNDQNFKFLASNVYLNPYNDSFLGRTSITLFSVSLTL